MRPGTQALAVPDTHVMVAMLDLLVVRPAHRWESHPDPAGHQARVAVFRLRQRVEVTHHRGVRRELIHLRQAVAAAARGPLAGHRLPV